MSKMPEKVKFYRVHFISCAIVCRYDELHKVSSNPDVTCIEKITYSEYLNERAPKRKYTKRKKAIASNQLQLKLEAM
jgi:hypothetical protein